MATAPDPAPAKQIDKLLECSICIETITEPRTLPCFHSFCKHCLAKFVATEKEAVEKGAKVPEVFECPVCRTKFRVKEGESIENMPPNHFINNLLREWLALTQQDQSIKCQWCKARNPAACRCISCERYLCEKCLDQAHNNRVDFENHVVLTLEELAKPENRAKARGKPRCEKHNKVLKFYCQTCKVLACRYCVDVNHPRPEHLWFPLTDVVVEHLKSLKASRAIFEQQANEAVQSSLKIEHAVTTLRNNATKTKDAIMQQQQQILSAFAQKQNQRLKGFVKQQKGSLSAFMKKQEESLSTFKQQQQEIMGTSTKKLEEETAALLDQVDAKYKKANEPLTQQQADVKDYLERAKSLLDFAKNIISSGNDEDILSLKQVIEEKAGNIENERPEYMEPVHNGAIEYQANRSEDILVNAKFDDLGRVVSPLLKPEEVLLKQPVLCLCERSKILNGDVDLARQLAEWLKYNIFGWKLCYRATDDGWNITLFHRKCDDVAPSVTLVKCGISVFGGFTDKSWKNPVKNIYGQFKPSVMAFLFSLRNKDNIPPFKCPIYDQQKDNAICCSSLYGATFGGGHDGGHDLRISCGANTNQYSSSNLGHTYQPPPGYQHGTPQTKALLAGSEYFTPTEVEVFCN